MFLCINLCSLFRCSLFFFFLPLHLNFLYISNGLFQHPKDLNQEERRYPGTIIQSRDDYICRKRTKGLNNCNCRYYALLNILDSKIYTTFVKTKNSKDPAILVLETRAIGQKMARQEKKKRERALASLSEYSVAGKGNLKKKKVNLHVCYYTAAVTTATLRDNNYHERLTLNAPTAAETTTTTTATAFPETSITPATQFSH
ncbi:hypothetical protein BDB00DRAFT_647489 [Zychaea mexicana]|uniref:uncharacterized protein n=1 Tax=Zychaea mexicana TaxID=64656 RepID=UPI0022FDE774|nr:uncharacterized protein BDB00DRAFT_647489 [Zychaea mexicana]KAI9488905.1 hypothetical protein BDB00DRAFT_647489 [Zychaea mexicana]